MKREFKTRYDLFKHLVENKQELIDLKRAARKEADAVNFLPLQVKEVKTDAGVSKATRYLYNNDEEKGVLKRTIIANTYNWLDSHGDVHLNNVFAQSVSQRGTKIPHLHDHIFSLDARVGKALALYEKDISWRELGLGKTGMTQALFLESEIKQSYNEKVYNDYLSDDIDQHSVAMQYVKIDLAVDDEENFPKEYEVWKEHIGKLGNRAKAEEQGYFWAVSEAKLFEVSAVLLGSNELTPTMGNKIFQPSQDTEKHEPSEDTREEDKEALLEAINKVSTILTT